MAFWPCGLLNPWSFLIWKETIKAQLRCCVCMATVMLAWALQLLELLYTSLLFHFTVKERTKDIRVVQLAKPKWRRLSLMIALLTASTVKQATDFIRENDYTIQSSGGHLVCEENSHNWSDLSGFLPISVIYESRIWSPSNPPSPLWC